MEAFLAKLAEAPWKMVVAAIKWLRQKILYRKKLGHFISPEFYYQRYLGARAKKSSISHKFRCVGRADELDLALESVDAARHSVVHITAPPGYGKSRFSLELARLMRGEGRGFLWYLRRMGTGGIWKVYFARKDALDLLEYVDEIRKKSRVAIFIDDAHRHEQQVRALANYAGMTGTEGELLLVCLSRSTMSNLTVDSLLEVPSEQIREISLQKLDKAFLREMVDEYLPEALDSEKDQIVKVTQDSVFLTAMVCQLAKQGIDFADAITEQQFRRQICVGPLEEAVHQCGVSSFAALRVAAVLSAASPTKYTDTRVRSVATELSGISDTQYDCIVTGLFRSALFEEYANELCRPTPDLIGALLIDSACIDDNGRLNKFASDLLAALLPHFPQQALNNLTDVGWTARSVSALDVVAPHLMQLRIAARTETVLQARHTLSILEPLAVRRSKEVIDYLELQVARLDDPDFVDDPAREDWCRLFGEAIPTLIAAARNREQIPRAMNIALNLMKHNGVSTPYSNHEPSYALSKIIGFAPHKPAECTLDAISVTERWFNEGGERAVIALNAVHGLLVPIVEWTDSEDFTITIRRVGIRASDQVVEARKRALQLILAGLSHEDRDIRAAAFGALDSVGRYPGGPGHDPDSDVGQLIRSEKKSVLENIAAIVDSTPSLEVQLLVEQRLWEWWRIDVDDIALQSEHILRKFGDDPRNRLGRVLFTNDLPAVPITEVLDAGDSRTRNERYFDFKRDDRESSEEFTENLLRDIGIDDDPEAWTQFFVDVFASGLEPSWRGGRIFYNFGRNYVEAAWHLVRSDGDQPWSRFRANLLAGLRDANRDRWFEELDGVLCLEPIPASLAIDWVLSLPRRDVYTDLEWRLISTLIDHPDKHVNVVLSDYLAHSGPQDWIRKREVLLSLAQRNLNHEKIIDNLFSGLVHDRPEEISVHLHDIDFEAIALLLEDELEAHIPWDRPYWVGDFLALVAAIDPNRFFEFVEESVNKFDSADEMHLRILGASNAEKAFKQLTKGEDRDIQLQRIFEWAAQDSSLGVLAGAILSKGIELDDDDAQTNLDTLYSAGKLVEIARIMQHFPISKPWLQELHRLLVEADKVGDEVFDSVTSLASHGYYVGVVSRTPGYGAPRDVLCIETFEEFLKDQTLSSRVREYYESRKAAAEEDVRRDIERDEALAGRRLTTS